MDPRKLFIDQRLIGTYFYCSAPPSTRDHIPSKVFLDLPYPNNLTVVECCSECNNSFSLDEEYFACFLECVIQGTAIPNDLFRIKVTKILNRQIKLQNRIALSRKINNKNIITWELEWERIEKIVLKLARGHLSIIHGNNYLGNPISFDITTIHNLTDDQLDDFNGIGKSYVDKIPELGSRGCFGINIEKSDNDESNIINTNYGWNIVQDDLYRYAIDPLSGTWVKIVLREFLACTVKWL